MTSDFAFKIIEEIAKARGNNKIQILKIYPDISLFLLAAYDPFTHYYLTKVKPGKGDMEFVDITWQILYKLSTRELSGHSAQMTINSITEGMTSQSSELFKRILNKDLRMGMGVKSINKAFPGLIPTHDVMLAKLFETDRVKYPCFGSPKIDGVRGEYKKSKFYSRGGHEYVGLGHLCKELQSITEPIDGELTIPNMSFQQSSGRIRSDSDTFDAVFNIIELPTIKEPYIQRLTMIRDLHQIGPHVLQIPRQLLKSEDEVFAYYKVCRNAGYEGVIITPYDYEYKGTRSYDWMKIKEIEMEKECKIVFS